MSYELFLGAVGSATGIVSLILYFVRFRKERPIVKIERFGTAGYENKKTFEDDEKMLYIGIKMKNKGMLPTTVERMYFTFNNFLKERSNFSLEFEQKETASITTTTIPFKLEPNSSEIFTIKTVLNPQEIKTIKQGNRAKISIYLEHTFGKERLDLEI